MKELATSSGYRPHPWITESDDEEDPRTFPEWITDVVLMPLGLLAAASVALLILSASLLLSIYIWIDLIHRI